MTDTSRTLRLESPPDDVNTVHTLLEAVWADAPGVPMKDRFSFETALIELASNVIEHADSGAGVSCTLTVTVTADRLEALLSDSGEPGATELLSAMPDELSESGRGIPLMRLLVDELDYRRVDGLNHWRIARELEP